MPERFGFPVNQRLWLPLRTDGSLLAPRTGPPVSFFGRLAPGASSDAGAGRTRHHREGARGRESRGLQEPAAQGRHLRRAADRRRRGADGREDRVRGQHRLPAAARRHLHERRDARVCPDRDPRLGGRRAQRARRQPRPHHRAAVRRVARAGRRRRRARASSSRNCRCGGACAGSAATRCRSG